MRYGVGSTLIADHEALLFERTLVDNDWDFFTRLLSYNRTRAKNPGDYFLFRPGLTGFLAAVDIFFRPNFFVSGLFSYALHLSACLLLFSLCHQFAGTLVSATAVLFFATHFDTSYMFGNRHVAPYIFSLLFYGWGVSRLAFSNGKSCGAPVLLFYLASLFHENAAVAALLLGGHLFLRAWLDPKTAPVSRRQALTLCLVPIALCVAGNALDFLIRNPTLVQTNSSNPGLLGRALLAPWLFLHVLGTYCWEWLIPQAIAQPRSWVQQVLFVGGGLAALTGFFRLTASSVPPDHSGARRWWVLSGMGYYLVALAASLTIFREVARLIGYAQWAKWYRYMGLFCLTPFAAWGLEQIGASLPRRKRWLVPFVSLLVLNSVLYGHLRRQALWAADGAREAAQADALYQIASHFPQDSCFAGSVEPVRSYFPDILLYRLSCAARSGTPLQLSHVSGSHFALSTVTKQQTLDFDLPGLGALLAKGLPSRAK
ncbi:MAG: hypothetical protein KDD51_12895 [Bdellovibrionales bacterium]|nr:hypothetical protein [Bdellovibrionales bacterium]